MLKTAWKFWLLSGVGLILARGPTGVIAQTSVDAPAPGANAPSFAISPPVACLRVEGLDQFTPLPDATLTPADKLKIYFRPLHYKVETDLKNPTPYRAKFAEDGQIRRKGEKTPIAKEDRLLEYETRYADPSKQVYLTNTIGLRNLTPGDYEFDIILRDLIDGQATAKQTLPFKVVAIDPRVAAQPGAGAVPPEAKPTPTKKVKASRASRKPGGS